MPERKRTTKATTTKGRDVLRRVGALEREAVATAQRLKALEGDRRWSKQTLHRIANNVALTRGQMVTLSQRGEETDKLVRDIGRDVREIKVQK